MSETKLADSLHYGGKLFVVFFWVVVFGVGGMALGVSLALPEWQAWLDQTNPAVVTFAGGFLLGFAGLAVFCIGLFGLAHKLISDAVADGLRLSPVVVEPADRAEGFLASGGAAASESGERTPRAGGSPDRSTVTRESSRGDSGAGTADGTRDDGDPSVGFTSAEEDQFEFGQAGTATGSDSSETADSDEESESEAGDEMTDGTGDSPTGTR